MRALEDAPASPALRSFVRAHHVGWRRGTNDADLSGDCHSFDSEDFLTPQCGWQLHETPRAGEPVPQVVPSKDPKRPQPMAVPRPLIVVPRLKYLGACRCQRPVPLVAAPYGEPAAVGRTVIAGEVPQGPRVCIPGLLGVFWCRDVLHWWHGRWQSPQRGAADRLCRLGRNGFRSRHDVVHCPGMATKRLVRHSGAYDACIKNRQLSPDMDIAEWKRLVAKKESEALRGQWLYPVFFCLVACLYLLADVTNVFPKLGPVPRIAAIFFCRGWDLFALRNSAHASWAWGPEV